MEKDAKKFMGTGCEIILLTTFTIILVIATRLQLALPTYCRVGTNLKSRENMEFENWNQAAQKLGIGTIGPVASISNDVGEHLVVLIPVAQNALQNLPIETLLELTTGISLDLLEAQKRKIEPQERVRLNYIQFEASISPIGRALAVGKNNLAYDWILNGFSDSIDHAIQRDFHTGRIPEFLNARDHFIASRVRHSFLDWAASFFYYCRSQNALTDVAEQIAPICSDVLDVSHDNIRSYVKTSISLMSWAEVFENAVGKSTAQNLMEVYCRLDTPMERRVDIAKSFTTRGACLIEEDPHSWAELVLENFGDTFECHEALQYTHATIRSVADWDGLSSELKSSAKEYFEYVEHRTASKSELIIGLDQRSPLLSPIGFNALQFSKCDDYFGILSAWYGVRDAERLEAVPLMIFPTTTNGLSALGPETIFIQHIGKLAGNNRALQILNEETNLALGISRTVEGVGGLTLVPKRCGQPNYDRANTFETMLKEFYNVPALADSITNSTSQLSIPHFLHPLQAISVDVIGKTLPISSSLCEPKDDSKIGKVALWSSSNDFYSSMEAECLEKFLTSQDLIVSRFSGMKSNSKDFIELYQDPSYDLIWCIGHGDFNHWEPGSATFQVSENEGVSIDQLAEIEIRKYTRRLLVFNICDGGTTDGLGGIQKLGLAPMLTGPSQAVVSHLWPVEPRFAAAIGVILAEELIKFPSNFFGAFEATLKRIKQPWNELISELGGTHEGELMGRLQECNRDTPNIFDWGSLVFYQ